MRNSYIGAVCAYLTVVSFNVNAALASNAILDFDDGNMFCTLGTDVGANTGCIFDMTDVGGSYFALEVNGNGIFDANERIAITSASAGLTLGSMQDVGEIDNAWNLGTYDGWHYTETAPTVISTDFNTAEINMSGWRVFWGPPGEEGVIDLGLGILATVECGIDCSIGDTFVLEYAACIPSGAFPPCPDYAVHLEGIISSPSAVPVPAAVWLFGSGLLGLIGIARRKKT